MTLLVATRIVLARWSRQDDVVLGTVTAGRDDPRLQPLVGFFVNTLALRGAPKMPSLPARNPNQYASICL